MRKVVLALALMCLIGSEARADLLVMRAKSYVGMSASQIGLHRTTLWCSAFVGWVTGHAMGDLARNWLRRPRAEKRVGAVVVLTRGRNPQSGHVAIVSGFRGSNPIAVSGNCSRVVCEREYPAGRVIAYVEP